MGVGIHSVSDEWHEDGRITPMEVEVRGREACVDRIQSSE